MKKLSKLGMIGAAVLFCAGAQANSGAVPPSLDVTSPTGTIFSATYPFTQNIVTSIRMNSGELGALNDFTVTVTSEGSTTTIASDLNAYARQGNGCVLTQPYGCTSDGMVNGTITVPWQVQQMGQYTIVVSARYRSAEGEATEAVSVANASVEYPAPPAVANAIMNRTQWKSYLSGKQKGCITSKVAEKHAKTNGYAVDSTRRGGPYKEWEIEQDIGSFSPQCSS